MPRTVPVSATQTAGNLITGALWNAGPAASNTFLTTRPAASVVQTLVQNLPTGSLTAVSFDSSIMDSDGGHSNSVNPSRYTCQVAGWHSARGTVGFAANGTGARAARFMVNGSGVNYTDGWQTTVSSGQAATCHAFHFVFLNVGDYVELGAFQTSGGTLSTFASGPQSVMTVKWVRS